MHKRNVLKQLALALAFAGGAAVALPSVAADTQQIARDSIVSPFPGNSAVAGAPAGPGAWDAGRVAREKILGEPPMSVDGAPTTSSESASCSVNSQALAQAQILGHAASHC